MPLATRIGVAVQILLVIWGVVLLWQHVVSPRARQSRAPSPLPPWGAEVVEFLVMIGTVGFSALLVGAVAVGIAKAAHVSGDAAAVIGGAGSQLGMLGGVLAHAVYSPGFRTQAPQSAAVIARTGAAAFLISVPIVIAVSELSKWLLTAADFPVVQQDLVRIFLDAESPWLLGVLIVLATVVAPLTEELVFRAGIFRYLRTRIPRVLAIVIPAAVFAALHVDWTSGNGFVSFVPLIALASIFSVAYERTGHIGTPIVAHALFNLNTIVLIFCGLGIE